MNTVLMLAAENGAIKGAKVGGMADVVRDLPAALASQDIESMIAMPGYGRLVGQTQAKSVGVVNVPFGGGIELVSVFKTAHPTHPDTAIYLFEHWLLHDPKGTIYSSDDGQRPFAEDANKFALFCAAVGCAVKKGLLPSPDRIHLHDWHAGFLALLRAYSPDYAFLQSIPCIYSIHNLAIQGIRPLRDDSSSLHAWFPSLLDSLSHKQLSTINDPRYPHCINPMRAAINLADRVHLVSPGYAKEVLQPSDAARGFFGGEGLDHDLAERAKKRAVVGILNGCNYPDTSSAEMPPFLHFMETVEDALTRWQANATFVSGVDFVAAMRVRKLCRNQTVPEFLMTSVGRLTDQKVLLLRQHLPDGKMVLQAILDTLNQFNPKAMFVLLGSGDDAIAEQFRTVAAKNSNLLFLNGYDEALSDWLYKCGDLFLMPSSFEPCGISQMLAMREGQPCLVHGVGGLKDTVTHQKSGFVFNGDDLFTQSLALLETLQEALALSQTDEWKKICRSAKARRFNWTRFAKQYAQKLYRF